MKLMLIWTNGPSNFNRSTFDVHSSFFGQKLHHIVAKTLTFPKWCPTATNSYFCARSPPRKEACYLSGRIYTTVPTILLTHHVGDSIRLNSSMGLRNVFCAMIWMGYYIPMKLAWISIETRQKTFQMSWKYARYTKVYWNVSYSHTAILLFVRREMLQRYPDAEATMGDGRRVGETGPDEAGNLLSPTTVKVRIDWSAHA